MEFLSSMHNLLYIACINHLGASFASKVLFEKLSCLWVVLKSDVEKYLLCKVLLLHNI